MIENRVRELRLKKGLTQRQLAELAKTSQQQVQRIESGNQSAKIAVAQRLAAVLETRLQVLFPGTASASLRNRAAPTIDDLIEYEDSGVDLDPCTYTFRVRTLGGIERDFTVSSRTQKRLRSLIAYPSDHSFLVFDSSTHLVAINPKELSFCQFLFDPYEILKTDTAEQEEKPLKFWLRNSTKPISFDIDFDDPRDEELVGNGEIRDLFILLEDFSGNDDDPYDSSVRFVDVDGEEAFIRCSHIALCTVPLEYVSSSYREAKFEGEEEEATG